jgi:hypothetical protein
VSAKAAKRARRAEREAQAEEMRSFMLRVVESLQRQFREHVPVVRERFPNQKPPCHTCALNPSTNDWQGMENTVLHFGECNAPLGAVLLPRRRAVR